MEDPNKDPQSTPAVTITGTLNGPRPEERVFIHEHDTRIRISTAAEDHGSEAIPTSSSDDFDAAEIAAAVKLSLQPQSSSGETAEEDEDDVVHEQDDEVEELIDDIDEDAEFSVLPAPVPPADLTDGCKHYRRYCQKKANCCGQFYPCRICHNEQSGDTCGVEMDRSAVKEIRCNKCLTEQGISNKCIKCGITFGKYYCDICHFWDNQDKGQYHCDGCGLCRVGGRENFKHCDRCRACYTLAFFDQHKCTLNALESNCPVCLEFLHTSRKPLHVPSCGHILHKACFEKLIASGQNFTCPTCGKAMCDLSKYYHRLDEEIRMTPMPDEYAGLVVDVLCNECLKHSIVPFHVLGAKCKHCGVYNTVVSRGPFAPDEEAKDNKSEDK